MLAVAEDLDFSGLPASGETICTYAADKCDGMMKSWNGGVME